MASIRQILTSSSPGYRNRSAVTPFRCLAAMPPEGNMWAIILPGCPSLDRGRREAEVGFEPQTLQSAQSPSLRQPYVLVESKLREISELHSFANKFGFQVATVTSAASKTTCDRRSRLLCRTNEARGLKHCQVVQASTGAVEVLRLASNHGPSCHSISFQRNLPPASVCTRLYTHTRRHALVVPQDFCRIEYNNAGWKELGLGETASYLAETSVLTPAYRFNKPGTPETVTIGTIQATIDRRGEWNSTA
ncbi:hypothetical protein T265_04815 [Opisthorchis viverrini]|uniref:Uncharacterized protein n=1 Tax=Opisthorchis viverrini TaxID=6198 RepID=A0A074ZLW3_OPIVI|nr:hypothetical protein T265_04815 [Opisthorchis viverrini]KER28358.1 hypothetical protein T265_04815 [Opisthorchis viverrini]